MNKTIAYGLAPVAALGLLTAVAAAPAAAITVDGNLGDWNVTVQDWSTSCGTNDPAQCHGSNFANVGNTPGYVGSFEEDTNDISNNYQVGPNYGGQNYDVEFMAAAVQGGQLYIGISSGIRPDNGSQLYGPGDIRIAVVGGATYAIEVGGTAPGTTGGGAIDETASGRTFTLNSSGYTTGSAANAAQKAGSIWKDGYWIKDPIGPDREEVQYAKDNPGLGSSNQTGTTGGTQIGAADYVYTLNAVTNQHSFIELAFDLSLLPDVVFGVSVLEIQWAPSCGNDIGLVIALPEQGDVPAPAALPLFLAGLGSLAFLYRRRRAG